MAKKNNSSNLISAILYILVGVLLIVFKSATLGWAMTIAGAIFIISGVVDLIKKNWMGGAVSLIIGIAILVLGWTAVTIVLLVLGILIAIKGLISLIDTLRSRITILGLLFSLLTVVIGLVVAFGNGLDIILVVCGALLVVDGVLGLLASFKK